MLGLLNVSALVKRSLLGSCRNAFASADVRFEPQVFGYQRVPLHLHSARQNALSGYYMVLFSLWEAANRGGKVQDSYFANQTLRCLVWVAAHMVERVMHQSGAFDPLSTLEACAEQHFGRVKASSGVSQIWKATCFPSRDSIFVKRSRAPRAKPRFLSGMECHMKAPRALGAQPSIQFASWRPSLHRAKTPKEIGRDFFAVVAINRVRLGVGRRRTWACDCRRWMGWLSFWGWMRACRWRGGANTSEPRPSSSLMQLDSTETLAGPGDAQASSVVTRNCFHNPHDLTFCIGGGVYPQFDNTSIWGNLRKRTVSFGMVFSTWSFLVAESGSGFEFTPIPYLFCGDVGLTMSQLSQRGWSEPIRISFRPIVVQRCDWHQASMLLAFGAFSSAMFCIQFQWQPGINLCNATLQVVSREASFNIIQIHSIWFIKCFFELWARLVACFQC